MFVAFEDVSKNEGQTFVTTCSMFMGESKNVGSAVLYKQSNSELCELQVFIAAIANRYFPQMTIRGFFLMMCFHYF